MSDPVQRSSLPGGNGVQFTEKYQRSNPQGTTTSGDGKSEIGGSSPTGGEISNSLSTNTDDDSENANDGQGEKKSNGNRAPASAPASASASASASAPANPGDVDQEIKKILDDKETTRPQGLEPEEPEGYTDRIFNDTTMTKLEQQEEIKRISKKNGEISRKNLEISRQDEQKYGSLNRYYDTKRKEIFNDSNKTKDEKLAELTDLQRDVREEKGIPGNLGDFLKDFVSGAGEFVSNLPFISAAIPTIKEVVKIIADPEKGVWSKLETIWSKKGELAEKLGKDLGHDLLSVLTVGLTERIPAAYKAATDPNEKHAGLKIAREILSPTFGWVPDMMLSEAYKKDDPPNWEDAFKYKHMAHQDLAGAALTAATLRPLAARVAAGEAARSTGSSARVAGGDALAPEAPVPAPTAAGGAGGTRAAAAGGEATAPTPKSAPPAPKSLSPDQFPNGINKVINDAKQGIPEQDIRKIAGYAEKSDQIIGIRPVEPLARSLLDGSYPTKNFNIKGKSSSWGPMASFIPRNQLYSKLAGNAQNVEKIAKFTKYNEKAITNGDARALNLAISPERFKELENAGLITKKGEAGGKIELTSKDPTGKDHTFYARLENNEYQISDASNKPIEVLGYEGIDKPIVPDYDLLTVGPSLSDFGPLDNRPLGDVSHEVFKKRIDSYGKEFRNNPKNAGLMEMYDHPEKFYENEKQDLGNVSPRVEATIDDINEAMGIKDKKMYKVHHNADEASMATDPKSNYPATYFLPKKMGEFEQVVMVTNPKEFARLVQVALDNGYHVMRNPLWEQEIASIRRTGFTTARTHLERKLGTGK